MKILHVTATFTPSLNGVAIAVDQLTKQLINQGVKVKVLAPKNDKAISDRADVIRFPSALNPLHDDYPVPLVPSVKILIELLRNFQPDIVHTHHPYYVGLYAKLLARGYKVPLVFTYHSRYESYADYYLRYLPVSFKKAQVQSKISKFCLSTDMVISPALPITEELKLRLPDLKITTIPSGLPEIPRVKKTNKELRRELKINPDKKIVLTVSRLSVEKNLHQVIRCLAMLPQDYFLILVGDGNDAKNLKTLAKQMSLESRIKFAGAVEHHELGKYYQVADVFAYSSLSETQGLIFLEALSFGLGIATIDSDSARQWINPKVGLLTQDDPNKLADGIQKVLKLDPEELNRETLAIASRYKPETLTKQLISTYQELIDVNQKKHN